MAAPHYPLVVAQYKVKEYYHWTIVVLRSRTVGLSFELAGKPGRFVYQATPTIAFTSSETLRGGCQVGTVSAANLLWLENKLNEVPIRQNDPSFSSQTWVIEALRIAAHSGLSSITFNSERRLRMELMLEIERHHLGDPTVEQRLYPEAG